jgi:ribosomal protein S1
MRIFSLATDEAVAVGDDIVIKVLEIDGDEVQLGIEHSDGMTMESGGARKEPEFESVPYTSPA